MSDANNWLTFCQCLQEFSLILAGDNSVLDYSKWECRVNIVYWIKTRRSKIRAQDKWTKTRTMTRRIAWKQRQMKTFWPKHPWRNRTAKSWIHQQQKPAANASTRRHQLWYRSEERRHWAAINLVNVICQILFVFRQTICCILLNSYVYPAAFPHGTVRVDDSNMTHFVADNLEFKIRTASPKGSKLAYSHHLLWRN